MSETPGVDLIAIEKTGGAIVARPQVKMLDQRALDALDRAIDQASEPEPPAPLVVLDLSRVVIVPSLALGPLMRIAGKCARRQQRLKLAAAQPQVRKVFALTRLDEVFQFADSVESAVSDGGQG
jgi:anti-anti-sigma factor